MSPSSRPCSLPNSKVFSLFLQYSSFIQRCQLAALLEKSVALNSTAYEGTTNKGTIEFIGNKTESALLGMTKSLGCDYAQTRQSSNVVELLPFSSQHKSMAAVELASDGKSHRIYVKGYLSLFNFFCI